MSLKIGQVNLIAVDGGAAFNVMYTVDDAFRASPPAGEYGIAVYAGKKLLSACYNERHSELSAEYSGDITTTQGYTNAKGIVDWKTPPRFTGLEAGRVAVNMYYASSAGPKENQLAGGAKSNGVHTILAYAGGKIVDAVVVTVEDVAPMLDNAGDSFSSYAIPIAGVAGKLVTEVKPHDQKADFGMEWKTLP